MKKKLFFMVYNAEKNLTPLYVSKKFYHQIEVWEKSFLHKPNHPYTAPLPRPPPYFKWSGSYSSNTGYQTISSPKNPSSLYNPPLH